jgi:hypothetical protein
MLGALFVVTKYIKDYKSRLLYFFMPGLSDAPEIGTYEVLYRELSKKNYFKENLRISIRDLEIYVRGLQPPEGLDFNGIGISGIAKKLQSRGYARGFNGTYLTLILPR